MGNTVKAVILAAGKGTRMKSALPKVLHKVLGKSLIERVISSVFKTGCISETIVITGHKSQEVEEHLQNYSVTMVLQEPQLGTGDALATASNQLADFEGTVLVLCGDTPLLTAETLSDFIKTHQGSGTSLTVMSALLEEPGNYGRIIRDSSGDLQKIVEERDATAEQKAIKEINTGVYCLDWKTIAPALQELTTDNNQGEYYLTDIVEWAARQNVKMSVFQIQNTYEIMGINTRKHLSDAVKTLTNLTIDRLTNEGVTFISPENTFISPETSIGEDSIVYPGCVIEGENVFGKNCVIGPHVFIRGNVRIGNNCTVGPFAQLRDGVEAGSDVRIGNFVEIKKSVIGNSTNVSHLSYIGDSLLGQDVNIGAGTITANYDPLTRIKSRTRIDNKAKIGSNCVLVAPVTVNEGASVAAGSVITKEVPAYSLAIARQKQQVIEKWVERKLQRI